MVLLLLDMVALGVVAVMVEGVSIGRRKVEWGIFASMASSCYEWHIAAPNCYHHRCHATLLSSRNLDSTLGSAFLYASKITSASLNNYLSVTDTSARGGDFRSL
ncbi:hypothetical protein PIB30_044012 [Stylosanthes scabra]|uniref:Secreted protein n=1 Tax=Stylosanthes scabra TaxID=79078 RepID=A0ABU6WG18_9FABA|nr:hypothetical protein [Stylosanthes scabra]